jgi:two-component sensor histidine kinase
MTRERIEQIGRAEAEGGPAVAPLARALRDSRASLTYRWLERIEQRVAVEAGEVFPTEDLLNHVPLLIGAIAEFVENPTEEGTAADEVIAKASELGEMRHRQGFSAYHVLREFEILGGILLTFFRNEIPSLGVEVRAQDALVAAHRLQRALSKVQQATAARYLALADEASARREERLRLIHDTLTGDLLPWLEDREETRGLTPEELRAVIEQVDQLADLSRPVLAARRQRNVPLAGVVSEATRRVRSIAQNRMVEVRVAETLPEVEVHDALVELCLVVLLTNAIRYSARSKGARWVEIRGVLNGAAEEIVVEVRDTGRPVDGTLQFGDLFRGDEGEPTVLEDEPGVGLRFVDRSIRSAGGRCWAEPAEDPPGSVFAFTLPSRRTDDAAG